MKRLSIAEAAQQLGVTEDVIRTRIRKQELVACQSPGYREYVWIRETSAQETLEESESEEETVATLKRELAEKNRLLEGVSLVDLKQQVAELQKRVEDLEAIITSATPMEKFTQGRTNESG